jgi:hypothetical protein
MFPGAAREKIAQRAGTGAAINHGEIVIFGRWQSPPMSAKKFEQRLLRAEICAPNRCQAVSRTSRPSITVLYGLGGPPPQNIILINTLGGHHEVSSASRPRRR